MTTYAKHLSNIPQSLPIPGKHMVANDAGGYAHPITCWERLQRFLILGCEQNTYYAKAQTLTFQNVTCLQECLDNDAPRTLEMIRTVSQEGKAPKNDPAIFALALASSYKVQETANRQAAAIRQTALDLLPQVCRTANHLFQFVGTLKEAKLRGWGRSLKHAVGEWFTHKAPRDLAYQAVKYQSRDGWTLRDLLRLSHPRIHASDTSHQDICRWILKGWDWVGEAPHPNEALLPIWAMERAKRATSEKEIVELIEKYALVRECIPTQWLTSPAVWEALLLQMPFTAMLRNLATMTRVQLLTPLSSAAATVSARLTDEVLIRKARIHPLQILTTLLTYKAGRGLRSANSWTPVQTVVSSLDAAFYLAFRYVEPTNKRFLVGVDTSTSMTSPSLNDVPGLNPRTIAAVLAMAIARVEPQHYLTGFTTQIQELPILPTHSLQDAVYTISRFPCGGTDCSLPIVYAMTHKIPVDCFVLLTDNQSWSGDIHPSVALDRYRQRLGSGARAVAVSMADNHCSILSPDDAGSLNIAGFSNDCPSLIAQHAQH